VKHQYGESISHAFVRYMLANHHRLVKRKELHEILWPKKSFVDSATRDVDISTAIDRGNKYLVKNKIPWFIGSMINEGILIIYKGPVGSELMSPVLPPKWNGTNSYLNDPLLEAKRETTLPNHSKVVATWMEHQV